MPFTNQPKSSTTISNLSPNSATFDTGLYFLLTELSGYILQENGKRIILDQSTNYAKPIDFTNQSPNSASFSKQSPNSAVWAKQSKSD